MAHGSRHTHRRSPGRDALKRSADFLPGRNSQGSAEQARRGFIGTALAERTPGVEVKVLPQEEELYLFAQSQDRLNKERAMRRRQLKALWKRLGQLQQMKLIARNLLLKLGEAKGRYPAAWRLIDFQLPEATTKGIATF